MVSDMSTAALSPTAPRTSTVGGAAAGDSFCPGCSTELPFETPPCDEHGADCPELACVICGWALIGAFEVAAISPRSLSVAG
jgi:hypothetical protein